MLENKEQLTLSSVTGLASALGAELAVETWAPWLPTVTGEFTSSSVGD
jgi:hypothetical protein